MRKKAIAYLRRGWLRGFGRPWSLWWFNLSSLVELWPPSGPGPGGSPHHCLCKLEEVSWICLLEILPWGTDRMFCNSEPNGSLNEGVGQEAGTFEGSKQGRSQRKCVALTVSASGCHISCPCEFRRWKVLSVLSLSRLGPGAAFLPSGD